MNPTNVLEQVLLACKTLASVAFAVLMGTHELCLGTAVFVVDFSLVSEEATRIREALQLSTRRVLTSVRSVVFVHVFAGNFVSCESSDDGTYKGINSPPLALPVED